MTREDHPFTTDRFADAIERIAERRWTSPSAPALSAGGVSLATVRRNRRTVARLLVSDLLAGRSAPAPGRVYAIDTDGKARRIVDLPLVELIIHDAVADWLSKRTASALSPNLYSYQPGLSYRHALDAFARYVRAWSGGADRRGLLVLKRDVRHYFDSIPVTDDAPVWAMLAQTIEPGPASAATWAVIRRVVRPLLMGARNTLYRFDRGVPTGSPVANVVANLYLTGMDRDATRVSGAFYARYGDDIVAAHPDTHVAATLGAILARHLEPQGLEFNTAKTRDTYLTLAGHAAPDDVAATPGSDVEFLGHRVCARGTVSLSRRKTAALLEALGTRATNGAEACGADPEQRIRGAVGAVNRLLDPEGAAAHPYTNLLRTTVTNRAYLSWLDHELALIVNGVALGGRTPRHFRRYPPRALRNRFLLTSVVVARNRGGRA